MSRPLLLDLFCCQGGAATGYHRAGFDVVGVDIEPQPLYPFAFIQADAMAYPLGGFDAVHASPPCQDHSETLVLGAGHGTGWMLAATLERLRGSGIPFVVENVDGAALARQDDLFGANGLELCGCMFPSLRGLIYENRLFETSFPVPQPHHVKHLWPQTKMGRPPKPGECMQVTGHFSGVEEAQRRMGAGWMTQDGPRSGHSPGVHRVHRRLSGEPPAAGGGRVSAPGYPAPVDTGGSRQVTASLLVLAGAAGHGIPGAL